MKTTSTKPRPRYAVISPDGFTIEAKPSYPTQYKAWTTFVQWRERYKAQGYYSSVNYGRIPLEDLHEFCQFKEI
jgi:hypothetical protein